MTAYVSYCDESIKLREVTRELAEKLLKLGAVRLATADAYEIPLRCEADKPRLFSLLRDMGIAFSSGREWSPAEQFEEFRKRGLIPGDYICIVWRGFGNSSEIRK